MSTWRTPVTNRQDGTSRMTYIDMNRITGNLDYLFTELLPSAGHTPQGQTVQKLEWTMNDIITTADWADILSVLSRIFAAIAYYPEETVTASMDYENINTLERLTLAARTITVGGTMNPLYTGQAYTGGYIG